MKARKNYARFYAIAREKGIDLAQFKEEIVSQFTNGRATSLRQMSTEEYDTMCDTLQFGRHIRHNDDYRDQLRRARSAALVRMQRIGIDTTEKDFASVNRFCLDSRIAGKPFGLLSIEELRGLVPKLEAIQRKNTAKKSESASAVRIAMPVIYHQDQIPS